MHREQNGFTLIELLVVILIVAILAAIAIPVFLNQRNKARGVQVQSFLKNAATAVESYYVDNATYSDLNADPHVATKLAPHGLTVPDWAQQFSVKSNTTSYCIHVHHSGLAASDPWQSATFENSVGQPRATPDDCP